MIIQGTAVTRLSGDHTVTFCESIAPGIEDIGFEGNIWRDLYNIPLEGGKFVYFFFPRLIFLLGLEGDISYVLHWPSNGMFFVVLWYC